MPDSSARLAGLRVLVVEDVADIRDVLAVLLRAEGADVAAAATGREAADLIGRPEFDVVLTDLGLPDIPGEALVRLLRAGSCRRPRIAVVTGYGEPVEWGRVLDDLLHPDLAASA